MCVCVCACVRVCVRVCVCARARVAGDGGRPGGAGVRFAKADLTAVDLGGADLAGADLAGAVLERAALPTANMTNVEWWCGFKSAASQAEPPARLNLA